MNFILSSAKGHFLHLTNLYFHEECHICERLLEDNEDILREKEQDNIIICKYCAYEIHSAYEGSM